MTADPLADLQAMLDAANREPVAVQRDLDSRLHGYQVSAVHHLWSNPKAGLLMQMGLGKSACVLQALTPEHFPVLVVAPKRVAENVWQAERDKWRPDLSIAIAAGSPAKRAKALESGADVIAIGRDNIGDIRPGQFKTVVLDELSSFKNRGSQRWKAASKITAKADFVWGLTGTPTPNGLMDLWAQLLLLDGGQRLGRTLTSYRQTYFDAGRRIRRGHIWVVIEWLLKEGSQAKIEERISDICMSMKASDYLELPPVTYNKVLVNLPPKVVKIYDKMTADGVVTDGETDHTAGNAAILTGKQSQITAGFLYPDADDEFGTTMDLHDAKTQAVVEIVEGTGSPVLVFYRFKEELARLQAAFNKIGILAVNVKDRGAIEAWNTGQIPVLLAHPASAGHGLNLQDGGHTIVWSTLPDFDLEQWEQSNARLARQGQTKPVIVHWLAVPNTVDEAIFDRLSGKATLQEALMRALRLEEE